MSGLHGLRSMMALSRRAARAHGSRLKQWWADPAWYLWIPVAHFLHWCHGFVYFGFRSKDAVFSEAKARLTAGTRAGDLPVLSSAELNRALASYMPPGIPFGVAFVRSSDLRGRFGYTAERRYSPILSRYQLSAAGAPSASVMIFTMFSDVAPDFYNETVAENVCRYIDKAYGEGIAIQDLPFVHAKEFAVAAGLGVIGKNALFYDSAFGFNCKISIILLHAELDNYTTVSASLSNRETDDGWRLAACLTCDVCIQACPVCAYDDFQMYDPIACERVISRDFFGHRRLKVCHACIASCPESNRLLKGLRARGVPRYQFWDYDRQLNALADLIHRPSFFSWVIQRFYFGAGIPGTRRANGKTVRGQQAGREGIPNAASEANNGWIRFLRERQPESAGEPPPVEFAPTTPEPPGERPPQN